MNGIVQQFADSPDTKEINVLSIAVTGTVTAMPTGSVELMWRAKAGEGNSGVIFVTTREDGLSSSWPLGAGDDTGWIPGTLYGYWYHGNTADDELHLWRLR